MYVSGLQLPITCEPYVRHVAISNLDTTAATQKLKEEMCNIWWTQGNYRGFIVGLVVTIIAIGGGGGGGVPVVANDGV